MAINLTFYDHLNVLTAVKDGCKREDQMLFGVKTFTQHQGLDIYTDFINLDDLRLNI